MKLDNLMHVIANLAVGTFAGMPVYLETGSLFASIYTVLFACVPMSVTKETMDEITPGNHWSWYEIGLDAIGMAIVIVALILFHLTD